MISCTNSYFRFWLIYSSTAGTTKNIIFFTYVWTCLHIVKIIRGVKRADPGRAEPSKKYQHTVAATAASLRPILNAVGFVVRWKSTFQYVRMSFCPENVEKLVSLASESEFSPISVQSCFPLLQGPSCRKPPSALFAIQLGYKPRSDRK